MWYLVTASMIWGLSFGLIKNQLAGLPPAWAAMIRLAVAAAVFLPFARRVRIRTGAALFLIGALQFGLMYLAYMRSFLFLQGHEVALFTVLTPLYVAAIHDLRRRRFNGVNQFSALLAVFAAAVILWQGAAPVPLAGFCLVQLSNLCFAVGQIAYRETFAGADAPPEEHRVFFWLYLGGATVLAPFSFLELTRGSIALDGMQTAALIYLGVVASGVGFFLWNAGTRRVSAGVLAVMNNLKIPAGVLMALTVFGESVDAAPLLAGIVLLGAALVPVCRRGASATADS